MHRVRVQVQSAGWRTIVCLCCFRGKSVSRLIERLAAVRLDLDESGDYPCCMPLIEQRHHVSDELSASIAMKRERKVCSAQTKESGHGYKRVGEDGQILIERARFQC